MTFHNFFGFAEERYYVYLRRKEGFPRSEWTQDPILQKYRFTNVFRELDATTVWFRENVREPMRDKPEVLLATVLFRWFNRVTTGEAIFLQKNLDGRTAWENLISGVSTSTAQLATSILAYCGSGPYVTGAYIIKTPDGFSKLSGVLRCVEWFMEQERLLVEKEHEGIVGWRDAADWMEDGRVSLEQAWAWFRQFPYLGDFMAYEIVTDLRHTALLDKAPDIMDWANPGPGAARGASRIFGKHKDEFNQHRDKAQLIDMMRTLLAASQNSSWWPQNWPAWEMRDVEHTLCEFDKYMRVKNGEGRPRGVYR